MSRLHFCTPRTLSILSVLGALATPAAAQSPAPAQKQAPGAAKVPAGGPPERDRDPHPVTDRDLQEQARKCMTPRPTERQIASCPIGEVWGCRSGDVHQHCFRPPVPPPFTASSGQVFPAYTVITLMYAPPGTGSQVVYGTGSTTGSSTEVKHMFKNGVTAGSVGDVEIEAGFAFGVATGGVWETHKEANKTISLTSQIDKLNHEKDTFMVWVNPAMTINWAKPAEVTMQYAPRGGQAMKVVSLTVAELRDPSKIPASKQADLAHFQPSDYQHILKLDPLASPGAKLDPKRYTLESSIQLDGPDHPKDPIIGAGFELSSEDSSGELGGFTTETTTSVAFSTKFSLFGLFEEGMRFGTSLEWDVEKATSDTKGTKQTATASLMTPTVERHDIYDVYYDELYKTFAFVSRTPATEGSGKPGKAKRPALQGTVKKNGKPAASEVVTITTKDKKKRRVATNAQGKFRAFDLDPGTDEVQVETRTQSVTVAADKPAELDIDLPGK
jgi:hypothetical protein